MFNSAILLLDIVLILEVIVYTLDFIWINISGRVHDHAIGTDDHRVTGDKVRRGQKDRDHVKRRKSAKAVTDFDDCYCHYG